MPTECATNAANSAGGATRQQPSEPSATQPSHGPLHGPPAAQQSLRLLDGHGGRAIVRSPAEATLLMEFFSMTLALDSALADDPSVVRVS